jgi:hypothetical protein
VFGNDEPGGGRGGSKSTNETAQHRRLTKVNRKHVPAIDAPKQDVGSLKKRGHAAPPGADTSTPAKVHNTDTHTVLADFSASDIPLPLRAGSLPP